MRTVEQIRAEIAAEQARIDDAYWLFTRTKKGRPPSLVVPDAYERRAKLQRELRAARDR